MTTELHVGDIGTVITVTVTDAESGAVVNISSATTKVILLRRPGTSVVQKTAEFSTDGSDGKLTYTTVEGDLDTVGAWRIQAFVELANGEWYSSIEPFDVLANLAVAT